MCRPLVNITRYNSTHKIVFLSVSESLETDYDSRDVEMVRSNDKYLECFLSTKHDLDEVAQNLDLTLKLRKDFSLKGNYGNHLIL